MRVLDEDLKIIKRKFGEDMAHFCRDYFPILLETKRLLPDLLLKKFEPSKFLYNDIVENNLEEQFKNFIYSLVDVENENEEILTQSPKELLNDAGYDLYECHNEADIQSFKKYYANGEELCTFHGGRLDSCYVFFAVKHDVDNIKREDFQDPKREDLYGTSVISIQFSRDNSHLLSIKNRYNHRVNNPDATFSNNLDNIISGLTKSFEDYYGMKQTVKSNNFEIPNYVLASDGKYYKYNYEINNVYYCPNNIVIYKNEIHRFEHDKYIVLDYFILDLVNKKIYLYDKNIDDCFFETIGEIEKIDIVKTDYGKEIRITNKNNEVSIIEIDKENKIIGYINESIEKIGDWFLNQNKNLIKINLPNVVNIGTYFLTENIQLKEISLPNVREIGNFALSENKNLKEIDLFNVRVIGDWFLYKNKNLIKINLSNVVNIGNGFLYKNISLKEINLPNVREIGDSFLLYNINLEKINLPNVEKIDCLFLVNNKSLKEISLPNVRKIGDNFLRDNENLEIIIAPKLLEVQPFQSHKELFEIVAENKKRIEVEEDKRLVKR